MNGQIKKIVAGQTQRTQKVVAAKKAAARQALREEAIQVFEGNGWTVAKATTRPGSKKVRY